MENKLHPLEKVDVLPWWVYTVSTVHMGDKLKKKQNKVYLKVLQDPAESARWHWFSKLLELFTWNFFKKYSLICHF